MGQPLTSLRQHFAPTAAADMDPSKLPLEMQAVAFALKAAGPRSGEDAQTRTVLDAIELEQSRTAEVGLGYAHALQEVQAGGKASHWVWYVWPSMDGVRTTSRPQFSLPSVQAHVCYINRKVLQSRLVEITRAATVHLKNGVDKHTVFMWSVDTTKVHECLTMFAVAAKLSLAAAATAPVAAAGGSEGGGSGGGRANAADVLDACVECLGAMGDGLNPAVAKWIYALRGSEHVQEAQWTLMMQSVAALEQTLEESSGT